MKIVVLDGKVLNPGDLSWEKIEALGQLTVYERTSYEEISKRIGDAEIILTNKTPITKDIIDLTPSIKMIGVLATGYDVVDYQYAKEKDILVCNVPAYSSNAVAQMVFALLLEVCHHVGDHNIKVKNGKWSSCPDFSFWDHPLIELDQKTMGIIGFGNIGKKVAHISQAFGMKVLVHSRTIKKEFESDDLSFVSLEELYEKSDVISLHCPLFQENKGFINKKSIHKMKDNVILINTARGALINEDDLKIALEEKKIYYAALDVTESEPPKKNHPLLKMENCIMTPHIAWATLEARKRLMDTVVYNIKSYIEGHPENVVNF